MYTHKEKVVATVGDPWRNDDVFFLFLNSHTPVFFLLLLNGKVNLQTRPSFSKRNEKSFWHIYGFRLVHKCLIGFVQWRRSPAALLVIPSSPERRYDHVRVSFSLSLSLYILGKMYTSTYRLSARPVLLVRRRRRRRVYVTDLESSSSIALKESQTRAYL